MIPNHAAARLSELDLRIAAAIPPGGNWRDVPVDVPSERLAQIRVSAAAGEGSRSTYYGRLRPDRPAYTINTYYNRPGNGCFLHPQQERTLSHREAARFQSFPDTFVFSGPQRAVCQQIGNAVPPLLALQIAQAIGRPGAMIDLFAGCGGLSLGFEWAGWKSLASVDIDKYAVETFNANVSPVGFTGDLNDPAVHDRLSGAARSRRTKKLALVGGPPCQGFSTGGKRRSPDDERNALYEKYVALLCALKPDVFVFENVTGLLNISGGKFLTTILQEFRRAGYDVDVWKLNAAEFGVPQRRQRVIVVGVPQGAALPPKPQPWTSVEERGLLVFPPTPTADQVISDLPPISAGEDGSNKRYEVAPSNAYQQLMRGQLEPIAYLSTAASHDPSLRKPLRRRA